MNRTVGKQGGGDARWERAAKVLRVLAVLMVGFVTGTATVSVWSTEEVTVDLYWKVTESVEPEFVGWTSIDVAPGEEFRVRGGLGREAILVFCEPGSENPCGKEGVEPKSEGDPGGEYTLGGWSERGRQAQRPSRMECEQLGDEIDAAIAETTAKVTNHEERCKGEGSASEECRQEHEEVARKLRAVKEANKQWVERCGVEER